MSLTVSFVERLEDVLEPAREFLSRDPDPFAKPRIVVPNAGTKAWLHDRLARKLGTSGPGHDDGVVANVEILYPGAITSLLQRPTDVRNPDPWSLDRLTFAVLDVITSPEAAEFRIPLDVRQSPLLTARRIAGRFNDYHVRRPGMILEWERGNGNPVLAPTANDIQHDGHPLPTSLRDGDRWQFEVWRVVRQRINVLSPPACRSVDHQPSRERLLVAGLESLTLPQLECLEALGDVCDVHVLLVHPSPGLRRTRAATGQQPLRADLRDRPLQKRRDPESPVGVDPLLPIWLSGAGDLEDLLAARATLISDLPPGEREAHPDSLLARMQRTVSTSGMPDATLHDPANDRSVVIHRCHSLSRQAEVLHDALLHAFKEIGGLAPHDVAIVSPCLDKAAPHLEAVFQRTVIGLDSDGKEREIKLPLVVADRGIRETSEAAHLLVSLLAVPGSRASLDDVLAVAGHPLVRTAFHIDDDTVATWTDLLERTLVRWGLDPGHRARHGLTLPTNADIHTWKLGLERMLLGAMLPDAPAQPELGGVVPLDDLDPVDIVAVTKLVRILDVLRTLDATITAKHSVADRCDAIERALVGLCGEECPQLAEPLTLLRRLRAAAAGTAAEKQTVPFEDVRRLLETWLDETSGRQPLRTGAITATSMVPLRGVPFKVVCVVGYDDGAVGGGESDGDDLVARQQLVGDVDPRADERRALLDCLLSAGTRLVITCNGRSVKSNKRVPLVTPLAELVDFAVRHGVARAKYDEASDIEIDHPRHQLSRRNFEEGGVWKQGVWSHDRIARDVVEPSQPRQHENPTGDDTAAEASDSSRDALDACKPVIDLNMLEMLVDDPLKLFLSKTLGIPAWRKNEEETPATLPFTLGRRQFENLLFELLPLVVSRPEAVETWLHALRRSGVLPFGTMGDRQVAELEELARSMLRKAGTNVPLEHFTALNIRIDLGAAVFAAEIPGIHADTGRMVMIRTGTGDQTSPGFPLHVAAIRLVAAKAAGLKVGDTVSVVARHNKWELNALSDAGNPIEPCQIRTVTLDPDVDPLDRLKRWCELVIEALGERRGLFGLRYAPPNDWEKTFESFVASQSFGTGGARYPRTPEATAYGMTPVFNEIFSDQSPERGFLSRFQELFRMHTRGMNYTLT